MKTILCILTLVFSGSLLRASDSSCAPSTAQTICPVSGEKLGEMGAPYTIDWQGNKVSFCCDSCAVKFRKDPAKYLSKIQATAKP